SAQKSTRTGVEDFRTSASKLSSVTFTVAILVSILFDAIVRPAGPRCLSVRFSADVGAFPEQINAQINAHLRERRRSSLPEPASAWARLSRPGPPRQGGRDRVVSI